MRVTRDSLVAVLNVDPTTVHLAPGFTLDLRGVGHLGTGDLEIRIASADELNRAEVGELRRSCLITKADRTPVVRPAFV